MYSLYGKIIINIWKKYQMYSDLSTRKSRKYVKHDI